MQTTELGSPVAYTALAEGTPVYASDGDRIGVVEHVVAAADQIAELRERGVLLAVGRGDLHDPAPRQRTTGEHSSVEKPVAGWAAPRLGLGPRPRGGTAMIVEIAVERYRFECATCGHVWSADYDVQYLRDADGAVFAFYRLDGVPVPSPAEEDLLCPVCRHGRVFRDLVARREVPVASLDSDEPRREVITTPEERRKSAPISPPHLCEPAGRIGAAEFVLFC